MDVLLLAALGLAAPHTHHLHKPIIRQRIPPPIAELTADQTDTVARALGYLVGAGSLLLYTPIALRVVRQGRADGLTLSTWWLKLASYACTDIYCLSNNYPISQFVETLFITAEAAVVLVLVAFYQERLDAQFVAIGVVFAASAAYALGAAPRRQLGRISQP